MSEYSTYFVTGCAGFIGAQVTQQLLEQGHTVVGIDNLNAYYDVGLKRHRLQNLQASSQFYFYEKDICDEAAVAAIFQQHSFDAVFNLAARAGVRYSMVNPQVYLQTNEAGNLNLLEHVKIHQVPKYILASTSSLYAGQEMPFLESLPVNTPISPYAASKKSAEMMAYSYHHLYGIDVSVVRYFTVYGPAGRPDMSYFRFIRWIDNGQPLLVYGDGEQARDFTFVDDIARGTIAAAKRLGFEVINLGGGRQPVSINTLIEKLSVLLGKSAAVRYEAFHKADMKTTWANIDKAKEILDWEPTVSLDEGLAACVQWYHEHLAMVADVNLACG